MSIRITGGIDVKRVNVDSQKASQPCQYALPNFNERWFSFLDFFLFSLCKKLDNSSGWSFFQFEFLILEFNIKMNLLLLPLDDHAFYLFLIDMWWAFHQNSRSSYSPKLYIPSTLNIDLMLWHTQLIVCAVKCWIMV